MSQHECRAGLPTKGGRLSHVFVSVADSMGQMVGADGMSGGMNFDGPTCPNCRKGLPYAFSFRSINLYNFKCPSCRACLRSKKATPYLAGCVLQGIVLGSAGVALLERLPDVPVVAFHPVGSVFGPIAGAAVTTIITVLPDAREAATLLFFGGCASLVTSWCWHFYVWKTDTLLARDGA